MNLEIINQFKKEKCLTNAQLAEKAGITLSTLDKITAGINQNPKLNTLKALCKIIGCRLDDFDDSPRVPNLSSQFTAVEIQHIKKYRTLDDHGKDIVDTVLDKEYDRVQLIPEKEAAQIIEFEDLLEFVEPVSAGYGIHMDTVGSSKHVKVVANIYTQKADYILRVSGNSMEPKYHHGDKILVQEVSDVDIGEIGVWIIDGRGFVKQKADGALLSLNPEYEPIYPMDSWQQVCQGRVLGLLDPAWVVDE